MKNILTAIVILLMVTSCGKGNIAIDSVKNPPPPLEHEKLTVQQIEEMLGTLENRWIVLEGAIKSIEPAGSIEDTSVIHICSGNYNCTVIGIHNSYIDMKDIRIWINQKHRIRAYGKVAKRIKESDGSIVFAYFAWKVETL